MEKEIQVSIIMGSDSDLPIMKEAAKVLEEFGISYEMKILSVHRTPLKAIEYAESLKKRKIKVIIGGAGGAAHLPGIFAALLPIPVIGVPIHTQTLNGLDSLYSIVQMPSGIPVATVAINGAKNAGILAATILSTSDEKIREKIIKYKENLAEQVITKDEKLQNLGYEKYLKTKKISSGKVREIYEVDNDKLLLVVSDRISAFDYILPAMIPNKGKVLNQISKFWFDYIKDIIPNHVISTNLKDFPKEFQTPEFEGRSMLVKKLKMIPIECIVRGYITGSGWKSYKENGTICEIVLPKGLQESQKLPEPIFTPTTKAELGTHDENISFDKVIEMLGKDLAEKLRKKTIEIYQKCSDYALKHGVIIADTKFEFGIDENGELVLADEVLTPDSSRFWPAKDYKVGHSQKSFDKQYIRDWIKTSGYNPETKAPIPEEVINTTSAKYIEAYEILTQKKFN